jgi:hypothetical protein
MKFQSQNLKRRNHFEKPGVDGEKILKRTLKCRMSQEMDWTDPMVGSCENTE